MDAFLGYNQIKIDPADEEKIAFVTKKGLYCYEIRPFSLKNIGATYQWVVNKVFKRQLGRNMEPYFDDMLVKNA